jgi:poly-gamma-glutamate capsule biosynthesis protein CapA/YwtB (metallophosphatase superfamily)
MARFWPVGLVMVMLAGCSAEQSAPIPTPLPAASSASAGTSPTPPEPSGTDSRPRLQMPLALIVQATRPVADVPVASARGLVAEGGTRWAAIGQPGGRMRVLTAQTGGARSVLRAVRESQDVLGIIPAEAVDPTVRVLTVGGRHPLRDPQTYPLEIASSSRPPQVTTLAAVGDVMLGRRVGRRHADNPSAPLRPLSHRLAAADVTVGNFEATLSTDGSPTQGGDSFAASQRVLPGLRAAGFDVLSLANNHVGDYGERALRQTLDRFADSKIATVGAGPNAESARRPVILERGGVRIGFLATDSIGESPAATSSRPGTNRLNMPPRTGPLDRGDLRRITSDIAALARRVDTVVVLTHWGTQYTHRPEPSQRIVARAFARAGADLVLGGHPHWVQGWEMAEKAVVVHSLGNFVFDMDFQTKTREGVVLEVVLWGGQVKAVEAVPYVIDDDFTPRLATGRRATRIVADVWSTSRGPFAVP